MASKQKMTIQGFFFRLGLVIAVIVCVFSVNGGYGFLAILVRTGLSFLLVYLLGQALVSIWKAISPPPPKDSIYVDRATIDVLLGALEHKKENPEEKDKDNSKNKDKNKDQNKIMNKRKEYPGQIADEMLNGTMDAGKQAEIVRKMGWGD